MEMLKIGVDLGAVFQMNEVCEGTYVKGVLFSFLQQLMKFNHQIVEIFIFSADNPSISPMVFESLSVHQLNIDQVQCTEIAAEMYAIAEREYTWKRIAEKYNSLY